MALAASLLAAPASAFAATAKVQINGTDMADGVPVTCGNGTATLNEAEGTLTLDNATIIASDSSIWAAWYALAVDNGDLNIVLVGKNRIESPSIGVGGYSTDLTFSGEGSLAVEAEITAVFVNEGSVTVDGCTIDVRSMSSQGLVCSPGAMTIQNYADVTVKSYDDAIFGGMGLSISNSTVTVTSNGSGTNAIYGGADISIDNSTVSASGTGSGASPAIDARGDIAITEGSFVTATSEDMTGIYAGGNMTIEGSTVTAEGATGIGMVVLGSLAIDDSTVTATGCLDPVTSAIYTESLEIIGASDVTCDGGAKATRSLVVSPAQGSLMDVMVGSSEAGAGHFDHCGVTSPLAAPTAFNVYDEGGRTALDWLNEYTYLRIGAHEHVFDQKVVADRYKVADATCTKAATYHYSCVCEETGTETFEYGAPAPLGHEWGEPTYTWSDDGSSCEASRICANDNDHAQAAQASVGDAPGEEPTCEAPGTTVYTATFAEDWADTQTMSLTDVPALGHSWGDPAWSWADGYAAAIATFTCQNDASHAHELTATVTSETVDPSATVDGSTVYTANVEWNGSSYTDTRTITIPATGTTTEESEQAGGPNDEQADGRTQTGGEDDEGATTPDAGSDDGNADITPLSKAGDGIAPRLACALLAASACGIIFSWRKSRKTD